MIEPTTQTIAALAASISGISLALLGVDSYSLLYGMVGALFALFEAERMGRLRAVVFVVLSTVGGAALGEGLLSITVIHSKTLTFVGCIVCGYGTQAILARLLRRSLDRIAGKPAAEPDEGGTKP